MAGVKITDLGTLTTAVDADLLYIVDVSDTSQSPQGTSKQIELGNLTASLSVADGVFQSTATAETGFAVPGLILNEGVFTRIGDTMHYGCKIDFTLAATGVGADQFGQFDIDFPQKINNFTDDNHSFDLTISETNPNTFIKYIVHNALKATVNITSIGTGAADYAGYLYLTAIYKK